MVKKQPRGSVRDYYTTQSKYGGQIRIHYMRRRGRTINNINYYKLFIAQESNGLTALGQLLFQQSAESYIYSALGSQASTRWPIVGQGATSLRTLIVFRKIVRDTIVEDDQTKTINNMRKAIVDTNVILNTAMIPVPGSLIILKQKIPGFNNILTMANYSMIFGLNDVVNKTERTKEEPKQNERSVSTRQRGEINNDSGNSCRSMSNVINHYNNSNIKTFTGRNLTSNIRRDNTKSNVGPGGGGAGGPFAERDTKYLVEMFAISAVGGFVGLKILSAVL